jgi:DNA repair exonuclease SbcCD ATPase subunit
MVNPEAEYYLTMSWAESVGNPHCVRGKKVRVTLEMADQVEGAWTDEAVQRHIDNLYSHGAHHVDVRQAPQPKDISEPVPEASEVHDDAFSTMPSIRNLVQPFLRAERTAIDSADISDTKSLTLTRVDYLLSIIDDHPQQYGAATPATTFHADLLRVEMSNFRGVSGNTTFNLDALSRGTVFLVASPNGNGKSTLLEAIFWCLYGKFLDPDVSAEEAIHTGKRSCNVTLYFRNGYTFTRSRAGKRPKFEISYCGTVVEQGHDAGTTTQYLESHLLHMTSETFRRTIVIPDHANSAFLAARDAQRAQSLDTMFGLDVLREYRRRLEENSKETKMRCREVQTDCDKVSETLKTLASSHQKCLSALDDRKTTIESKKTAIQTLRRKCDDIQDQLQQKQDSMQKSRRTVEILEGKIARLRHQVKLYETVGRLRRDEAEVERYQVALAKEEEKQEHIWTQIYSFARRMSRPYLIHLISTISHVGAQLTWLNRFLAPVARRSQRRLTILASSPVSVFSQNGLSKLMEKLRKTEAYLHMLTEEISPRLRNSSRSHKEAHFQNTHEDEEEQAACSCPVEDCAFHSMDELQLPQISQLLQEADEVLQLAQERHKSVQASLTADKRDRVALSQQIHEMSHDLTHHDGCLEEMLREEVSHSQEADQLMQGRTDLLQRQKTSLNELTQVEAERTLATFWLEQLQDTATQKGPFITYCRARHVHSLNVLIAQVLDELNQDSEGIATQCLDFQLKPDYSLEPIHGALSMGKRSKGQKTRTYLALFLAMFQQARSRLPLRTSFVFLDEVMDTLDLHGIEALQRWLQRYVAAREMQAFLLTHRETSLLGKVIEVVRDRKRGTVYKLRQEETAAVSLKESKG